jgi:hypothetical protein
MYSIPDFAGLGSGGGSGMINSGQFDFGSLGGMSSTSNQYMNYPSMSGDVSSMDTSQSYPPGVVPPAPFTGFSQTPTFGNIPSQNYLAAAGQGARLPGQQYQARTIDPAFTAQLDAWLRSQMGQGATPFDLSAALPSGGTTAPGQLTAPDNPILQALQQFYLTGTGGPLPGVLPMWQSEMKSMQIPIEQQMANIKEQFGARGALGSSEMASAMGTFGAQTAADQEALLGQLTLQALPGMEQAGMNQQQLDQGSIDRLVQEFIRTRPEYSPLLGEEFGFGTTFPPTYSNQKGAFGTSFLGGLGQGLAGLITG